MSRKRNKKIDREQQFPASIQSLSHDGRGIAEINGKKTFISFALPGEEVMFSYTSKRSQYAEGVCREVIKVNPERSQPPCQFFTVCGGCSMQHLLPPKQIAHKQQVFCDHLRQFANIQLSKLEPTLTAASEGYRRKARLGVKYVIKKEKVLIGFREKNGRYLADMNRCEILHPSIGHRLEALAELIASLTVYDAIAQLEIAVADNTTACVVRNLKPLNDEDKQKLIAFAKKHQYTFYLQPKGPDTVTKLCPDDGQLLLETTLKHENIRYHFHPLDFLQVNAEINEKMMAQALQWLDPQPNETVADLFCGIGNFSLPLAKRCHKVIAVEGEKTMTERGQHNAKLNQIENIDFITANLFAEEHDFLQQTFDKVLLDPPRAGAKEIIAQVAKKTRQAILYISCNTATLARDTKILSDNGFMLTKAGIMDMFPHTAHVEAMALFTRSS